MKIRDILTIREFEPVVDLTWGLNINEHERMLSKYIMTDDIAETFVEILESFNMIRSKSRIDKFSGDINSTVKRAHILSGQYGTGKSYFLLMLSIILEMKNSVLADKMINHFKDYPELQFQLKAIQEKKKYFVVRINGESENQKEFIDVIQSKVIESLEKEFKELKIGSIYSSVKHTLEKAYSKFSEEIDDYLYEKDESYEDLLASLSNYRKEGLEKAKNLIKDVLHLPVQVEVSSFDQFLSEVNTELSRHGYNELVIIFDEFSAYITASIENKRINKDLGQIQTLSQLTSRNTQKNVGFIVSLHKDINDVLESHGVGNKNELDKIMGRFEAHTLKFEQGNELVKNTLSLEKIPFKKYEEKYKDYISTLEKKYNQKFVDFYPIHPSTIEYLMPISQIYAQKTRTTLGFIKEVVKEKYFSKEVEEDEKLNLVNLSDLFEAFEEAIENKKPEIIDIYNQSINEYSAEDDVIKYLRAITIAYSSSLTKTSAKSELTAEDIKDIYQEPTEDFVRESLNRVVNTNYSNVIVNNGAYRLIAGTGGVKLDKKISEQMENISATTVMKSILEKSENRIFLKRNYDLKYNMGFFPFDIKIEGLKVNLEELNTRKIDTIIQHRSHGKIIFVSPDFHESYDKEVLVEEYTEKFKGINSNVCIAFAKENPFKESELREYGALLKIESTDKEVLGNEELAKIIVTRRRKLEDKIRNKYLRKFSNLRNFTFVFGGGKVDKTIRSERVFFEELLFNYYTKFPREIKVENFNTRAGINDVVKLCLDRGVGEFSKNDTSSGVKQLKMLLAPLDLIKFVDTVQGVKFQLKMPGENATQNSKEIMEIILDETSLKDKYKKLESAPYGLSDKLVDLYIFVANKTGKISILTDKGKHINLDAKNLEELSKKPEVYKIETNDEFLIPGEVEKVWDALNSLRIVKNSKARDFKADSNNDFDPARILNGEIRTIFESLDEKEKRLRAKGIKTKELKKIVDKLKDISVTFKPEDFFEKVVELPNIMDKNSSFEDNVIKLKEFLIKLRSITNPMISNFESAVTLIPQLDDKIIDLNSYNDLKENVKEIEVLVQNYSNDFLNVTLVEEVILKVNELLNSYNNEYKIRHDSYYEEFSKLKEEFLVEMKLKLDIINGLEVLNFRNISSIDQFVKELISYSSCEIILKEGVISTCKSCDKRDLKKLEGKKEELKELFLKHKKIINGIFESYIDSLREDSLKKELSTDDNYKKIIFAMDRVSNEEMNGTEIEDIIDSTRLVEDKINNIINSEVKIEKNIEFEEITEELLLELQGTGQKYLNLDEVKNRFETIIDKYKNKGMVNTKI
ncbi:MAG: BREX system ATP-binding domain-containing protein [Cetobacterium sp.]